MNLHLLPEEMIALADILEEARSPRGPEIQWNDTKRRVADYVAGVCRSQAALKGQVSESSTTKGRRCELCTRPGGVKYPHPEKEGETIIAHPYCLAKKVKP